MLTGGCQNAADFSLGKPAMNFAIVTIASGRFVRPAPDIGYGETATEGDAIGLPFPGISGRFRNSQYAASSLRLT
jgi:hypothetical protein